MGKIKAHELKDKRKDELLKQLEDLRNELGALRVAKVSGQGGPSKLAKIQVVRKSIARVLTVYNQAQRSRLRQSYRKKKYKPLDLRVTQKQREKLTVRQKKIKQNFGYRKYALKA